MPDEKDTVKKDTVNHDNHYLGGETMRAVDMQARDVLPAPV